MRFLAGFDEDENRVPITRYLERNSPEERQARTILARQLRENTLGSLVRDILALALDPETPSLHGIPPVWRIEFTSSARRNKSTWARDWLIVDFIRHWRRKNPDESEEVAIGAAEDEFGLVRSRIAKIWQEHKSTDDAETTASIKTARGHHVLVREVLANLEQERMNGLSLSDQITQVEAEAGQLERGYKERVAAGQMNRQDADHRIAILHKVTGFLRQMAEEQAALGHIPAEAPPPSALSPAQQEERARQIEREGRADAEWQAVPTGKADPK
jgi:hypothetical protein